MRAVAKRTVHMLLGTTGSVSWQCARGGKRSHKRLNLCYVIHLFRAPPLHTFSIPPPPHPHATLS